MRELHIMEVESVSAAGFFSRLSASVIGGITGLVYGAITLSSNSIIGTISKVTGAVTGAINGATSGFANDWDKKVAELSSKKGCIDLTTNH